MSCKSQHTTIMFVIPSLSGGGAERVIKHLLENMSADKYRIFLVLFQDDNDYRIESSAIIETICLNKKNRWSVFLVILKLWYLISKTKPDIVISLLNYANMISVFASLVSPKQYKLILCEHNYAREWIKQMKFKKIRHLLMKFTYKRADKIIAVSNAIKSILTEDYSVEAGHISVIYNPIPVDFIKKESVRAANHPFFVDSKLKVIICVGRLERQKRIDRLLRAFSTVVHVNKDVRLLVLGKGSLLDDLKKLSDQLGINNVVDFVGFKSNPHSWISKSKVFALSSDYEGFPMVILEAMTCGTPVVSTDCPSGPNELIINGVNGILVPLNDDDGLSRALNDILCDETLQNKMAQKAFESIQRFDVSEVLVEYEKCMDDVRKR